MCVRMRVIRPFKFPSLKGTCLKNSHRSCECHLKFCCFHLLKMICLILTCSSSLGQIAVLRGVIWLWMPLLHLWSFVCCFLHVIWLHVWSFVCCFSSHGRLSSIANLPWWMRHRLMRAAGKWGILGGRAGRADTIQIGCCQPLFSAKHSAN